MGRPAEHKTTVLVLDGCRFTQTLIERVLSKEGYLAIPCQTLSQAFEVLQGTRVDILLLDKSLMGDSTLNVTARIKSKPETMDLPIIMMTSSQHREEINAGIRAGIYFFLQKPLDLNSMRSVLGAADSHIRHIREIQSLMQHAARNAALIRQATFEFKTLEEAESLAALLANCGPEPSRHLAGLVEILINALEHGNLGIGYATKTRLMDEGVWKEEVLKRQSLPQHRDQAVCVQLKRTTTTVEIHVEDQGDGFDWQKYMHFDPQRVTDNHGRGIAMAKALSVDELTYNERGNVATLRLHL